MPSASYFPCKAHALEVDIIGNASFFRGSGVTAPVLYESCSTDVLGQLVPLRRLSVLIGHGVPPGYPSRVVLEPLRPTCVVHKPRASIYLWCWIARVYVEPPLHNHNVLLEYRLSNEAVPRSIPISFVSYSEISLLKVSLLILC